MIIQEQRIHQDRDWDYYVVHAVVDELSRTTTRAFVPHYDVRSLWPIRKGQLVAPEWTVQAHVTDDDLTEVSWGQDVAIWHDGGWRHALYATGANHGVSIAGVVHWVVGGVFDMRTGAFRISEGCVNRRTGRRVRPSPEEVQFFAAWLRQWLPDRSPIKNPGRVRRRA
jgi:hypothetical protein